MAHREITVDTSVLAIDIHELQAALIAARAQLKDMFQQMAELNIMWNGPANAEFNRQFRNDHERMADLCKAVEQLIDCMGYARDQYNACENEVNSIVSAIRM